ncbi:uncharacterized protein [Phaseolus vulgaris]|uniref:uncharacterized protein n=1 Tax=Phaseolus vulgaris TaxID=3885 RepID=UPI0035C9870F
MAMHMSSPLTLPSTFIGNRDTTAPMSPSRCGSRNDARTEVHVTATLDTTLLTVARDAASPIVACDAASPTAAHSSTVERDATSSIVARKVASSTVAHDATSSSAYRSAAPATPAGDGGLMVAETPSKYGSDSTYSLVVRRPLSVVAVHPRGFSASPIAHVRLLRRPASFSGGGQRLLEVRECNSSNSQEVGFAHLDGINELPRKKDVRFRLKVLLLGCGKGKCI